MGSALLAAVEEACGEEDHRHQKGELGVLEGVLAQGDGAAEDPDGASGKPYPCGIAHAVMMPQRSGCGKGFMGFFTG